VTDRSDSCANVLHSPRFWAGSVPSCGQACWAVVRRLVGIASADGHRASRACPRERKGRSTSSTSTRHRRPTHRCPVGQAITVRRRRRRRTLPRYRPQPALGRFKRTGASRLRPAARSSARTFGSRSASSFSTRMGRPCLQLSLGRTHEMEIASFRGRIPSLRRLALVPYRGGPHHVG
jgi:hypothetical protein